MVRSNILEDLPMEVSVALLSEWLPFLSTVVRLDQALCNRARREKFHELLGCAGSVFDVQPVFDKKFLISQEKIYQFYVYVRSRKLKVPYLPVTNDLKSDLLTDLMAVTGRKITRVMVRTPHSEKAPQQTYGRKVDLDGPFREWIQCVPKLQELSLVYCDGPYGWSPDGALCPQLRSLSLDAVGSCNKKDGSAIASLLQLGGESLRSFHASDLYSRIPFKKMGEICPNLCAVSFSDCYTAKQLAVLTSQCVKIRHVDLYHTSLTGPELLAALSNLPKGELQTLRLHGMFGMCTTHSGRYKCVLSDADLAALGAHHGASLTTLWLSYYGGFSAAGLTGLLRSCAGMKTLYLRANSDAQLSVALFEAMQHTSIKNLFINYHMKDPIALAILRYGQNLVQLGLNLPTYSREFPSDVLCNARSLQTLYVSHTTPANVSKVLSWRNARTMKIVEGLPSFDFSLCV